MQNVKFEKKLNKRIIGAVIGSALIGAGSLSMTPKGKGFRKRFSEKFKGFFGFMKGGIDEMKKTIEKK